MVFYRIPMGFHRFPMVFHRIPMVFHRFPMVFHTFPMVFHRFSIGFLWFSIGFLWFSIGFSKGQTLNLDKNLRFFVFSGPQAWSGSQRALCYGVGLRVLFITERTPGGSEYYE